MRTFNLLLLASLAIAFLAGCPAAEDNCASTTGCGDDGPQPDGGGAGGTEEGIPSDAEYCADPEKPMRCLDEPSVCHGDTYDCRQPAYACGGSMFTCHEYGDEYFASCCDGMLSACSYEEGFYCPDSGGCVAWPPPGQPLEQACPSITRCTFENVQCVTTPGS